MFRKNTKIAALSTAATLLLVLSGCGEKALLAYENENQKQLAMTFEKPTTWTEEDLDHDGQYTDYILYIPDDESQENQLQGKVGISKVLPGDDAIVTLNDEFKTYKNLFKKQKNFKVLAERNVTMLGESAKEFEASYQSSANTKLTESVVGTVVVHNNTVYYIVLDDDTAEIAKYRPVYEKIRASMKLTP